MKLRTISVIAIVLFASVLMACADKDVTNTKCDKTPDRDRLDWVCTTEGVIETCCPPGFTGKGDVCTETIL